MPEQFENYTKQEVKRAIKQDIANLKRANRFSLYELYNLAEKREMEQQNKIDNVPEDVNKEWKYTLARKQELNKLKKHHEDILGAKAQRKSVDAFTRELNNKRNRNGQLSIDVIERVYSKNALKREDSVNDIFENQIAIPDKVRSFSTIEEQCRTILKSNQLDVNDLKNKVADMLGRMSGLDKELNVLGSYKTTFSNKQALENLMKKHPKITMMILRQGAMQGAYNELTSHIANGGVDDVNLKKIGELHKELIVGNLLINEFSMTSDCAYVADPAVEMAKAPEKQEEDEKIPEKQEEDKKIPEKQEEDKKIPEKQEEDKKIPEKQEEDEKIPEKQEEDEKIPEKQEEDKKIPEKQEEDKKIPEKQKEDKKNSDKLKKEEEERYKARKAEAITYVEERKEKEKKELIAKISNKYQIPDNASDKEKIHIAYNRMAALLGIENSLQQKKQKVDYTNMLDMFKVLDAIPEEQEDLYETFWTGDAVEKVVDIQSMDRLFGVQRERKDYLGNIIKEDHTKQEDNGKNKTVTHYIYEDIVACEMEASKYFRKDLKEKQKSRCMNIDFATKLSNLNIDDYRELFDMPSSKNLNLFQNLKDQILKAKKELADKKIVLIRKDIYKVNSNINLIDDVLENNCAFHTCNSDADLALSGERVVEKLQHSGRPANYREDKLSKWLKENEAGRELGNTAASVYNEMEAYFKEIESGNWLNISYHKQFEKMVKAICDWRDMLGKTAAEKKLCESLITVYCEVYGADSLAKTHLLLDKEIKECEKEDENAKIYYNLMVQYERDREIAACDKKEYEGTDEEQKTEREKEKEQLRKAYDDYSKTMILDKTNVPLFPHRPCIEDIMQGGIGDCYLLASLAAVVKINPEAITSMLHDYGNIVKVSFDAKHVVYVSKKIFEGKSARNTLWVQIIEKAYGKAFKQKEQKIEDEQKDIKELVPYFMKQSEAKEFLENQVRKEADLLKKPEESEAFLKAQMGIDALLKRAYFSTHLWISGGRTQDALNNLYGFKNTKHLTQEYALYTRMIDTAKSYRKLCGSTAKNDDLNNEDAKLKIFIREHIQENLLQEMAYRLRDKNYKGYRAVTIEDFVDALKDIKNWKNQDNVNVFYRLLTEVKTEFPDVDESAIMKCLDQFGKELMEAGLEQDAEDKIVFGYRADLKSKTPNYTPKAKKWYALMEQACKNKLEVTAGSHRFGNIFNEFVKKNPTVNGIAQGHGFTVTNVYEQEGHYFVTLRNPWAQDLVEYRRKTNADGSVEITLGRITGDTDISRGEFSLELNDFMNEFNQLTAINAEEKFEWEMKKTEEKVKKFKQKRKA